MTREIGSPEDVGAFFDGLARDYRDGHGAPDRLLRRRLAIIRRLLSGVRRSLLVEIGCGTGIHLFSLAGEFEGAVGADLSPNMIESAAIVRRVHPYASRISLIAESAETMSGVGDGVADAVLCVGAFEHMLDKPAVLKACFRILKRGGSFICLTPNREFLWYTVLGPMLGLNTSHLSSDRFLKAREFRELLISAGLLPRETGYWTFIPKGDMPVWLGALLSLLDRVGRAFSIPVLRGGLYVRAEKP